jgi:transposase-like protein
LKKIKGGKMEEATKSAMEKKAGTFTASRALKEFNATFLDETRCRRMVINMMSAGKIVCPGCGEGLSDDKATENYFRGERIKCKRCDKYFTALTDTFLSWSQIGYGQVFLLAALLALGHDNETIAHIIGVSPETVRNWRKKFAAMEAHNAG